MFLSCGAELMKLEASEAVKYRAAFHRQALTSNVPRSILIFARVFYR